MSLAAVQSATFKPKASPPVAAPAKREPTETPATEVAGLPRYLGLQPKFMVGTPDDPLEGEADRVADHVMRMPEPGSAPPPLTALAALRIQRRCVSCSAPIETAIIQRKCAACAGAEKETSDCHCDEEKPVRRRAETAHAGRNQPMGIAVASHSRRLQGGGAPLPQAALDQFEPRFGHDFSTVRVHTGAAAAESARELGAHAYTVGHDIVFAAGQFAPDTQEGRGLLAHELVHVVQQEQGGGDPPGAAHEEEADQAARAVQRGSFGAVTKASTPGVPQFAPNDELDQILKLGPKVDPPTAEEIDAATERLKAGAAASAEQEILLRQSVADARTYIQAEKGRPLDYVVCRGNCGPGRDVASASFGSLASESSQPISIVRFQARDVFGRGNHAFSVVKFADGTQYLVDPTFAQFLRPGMGLEPGRTAQILRADSAGAALARDLVQNGFVPLTVKGKPTGNAQIYARGLGVPGAELETRAADLLGGKNAVLTESVGLGSKTAFQGAGGLDFLDRSEIIKYARKDVIPKLEQTGDPQKLLPKVRELLKRLEESPPSPPKAPPVVPGEGGGGGGGGGGLFRKLLLGIGIFFTAKNLYEAAKQGTGEFFLAAQQELATWASAVFAWWAPLATHFAFSIAYSIAEGMGWAFGTVLPGMLRQGLGFLSDVADVSRTATVGLFSRGVLVARESLNPVNWDTRSMPADLVVPANQLGMALWEKLEPLDINAFRDSMLRPLSDFGLPSDALAQYAKATFVPTPIRSMTPVQLINSLKTNKLRFVQDPEYLADQQGESSTKLGPAEAPRLHDLAELRASLNPYNWDFSGFPNLSTRAQDIANFESVGHAMWAQLEKLGKDDLQKATQDFMSGFKLSTEQIQNLAETLTRTSAFRYVQISPELVEDFKGALGRMTPRDLINFMKQWANLRFKKAPAGIANEAMEAVRQGYQPW